MDDLPDTIRLTEEEQEALARQVEAMMAERPPAPEMTDAEIDDLASREGEDGIPF